MRLYLCCVSDIVFKHQKLSVGLFDLVFDFLDLSLHHVENILESGNLFVLLPFLGLSFDLQVIFLLQYKIYLNSSSLLSERLLIHPYFLLHLLVLQSDLLAVVIGLRHDRKGRLGLIVLFCLQFLKLTLHGFDGLQQFIFLAHIAHHKRKWIMEPKWQQWYFFYLSDKIK